MKSLVARVTNRTHSAEPAEVNDENDASRTDSSAPGSGTVTPIEGGVLKAGRSAAVKVGGKRRGAVRKR